MNKSLRSILSLSWQSVVYGIGILGSQLIIYVMLPFLTRYMPQAEYGVVSVITAMYAFLNNLTNAGLPSATFRYYTAGQDANDQRITIGASQSLFFLFAFLPATSILLFPKSISTLLLGSGQYALVLQVVACFLVVNSMNTFGSVILRIRIRPFTSSIHNIILIACKTGLTLLFVITYDKGVLGYWLGQLIGEVIGLAFMTWFIRKDIVFQVSWNRIWDLVKFGFPLIPATLSMNVLRLFDRYIISALAGLEQVAIYDVGYKIGTAILFLIIPFRTAWIPFAFSLTDKPEAPKIYRDVLTYITAGCSLLILGVIAFRVELINLIAPASYSEAVTVVGWVAASQLFLAAYYIFSIGPMTMNKTRDLVWAALAAAGVNLLLNFILIPQIGILGAAIATFVGYLILAVWTHSISRRVIAISIDWKRLSKLLLSSGLIILVTLAIDNLMITPVTKITFKALGLLLFPVILLLVGFISRAQSKEILELGKSMVSKKKMKEIINQ